MLFVLGFLLRNIDLSLWLVTLGPVKTVMVMLKGRPKVHAPAPRAPCACPRAQCAGDDAVMRAGIDQVHRKPARRGTPARRLR